MPVDHTKARKRGSNGDVGIEALDGRRGRAYFAGLRWEGGTPVRFNNLDCASIQGQKLIVFRWGVRWQLRTGGRSE